MRALRFVFSVFLGMTAVTGCKDIPRDNLLDPKNPNSLREQTVLIEAFVNTNEDLEDSVAYNQNMLSALKNLKNEYDGKVLLTVHHRSLPAYPDILAINESEDIYRRYVGALEGAVKGVPDVFINALGARIQGATTAASAELRIGSVLQDFLIRNSYFTIEPAASFSGGTLRCTATIARLGTTPAYDILVKLYVLQNVDERWLSNAVREVRRSNLLPELQPGERREVDFGQITGLAQEPIRIVASVVSEDEFTVYQAVELGL